MGAQTGLTITDTALTVVGSVQTCAIVSFEHGVRIAEAVGPRTRCCCGQGQPPPVRSGGSGRSARRCRSGSVRRPHRSPERASCRAASRTLRPVSATSYGTGSIENVGKGDGHIRVQSRQQIAPWAIVIRDRQVACGPRVTSAGLAVDVDEQIVGGMVRPAPRSGACVTRRRCPDPRAETRWRFTGGQAAAALSRPAIRRGIGRWAVTSGRATARSPGWWTHRCRTRSRAGSRRT